MNKINLHCTYLSNRYTFTISGDFLIDYSSFQNIATSSSLGGGIYIETASNVIIESSLFRMCSSSNFGGAFYILGSFCKVSRSCCIECYHTVAANWNNGGGGYMKGLAEISHELSSVVLCAPDDKKSLGAHCCFGIESEIVNVKSVNASEGSVYGYIVKYFMTGIFKFNNFDQMSGALLYLYIGEFADISMSNFIDLHISSFGACFCRETNADLDGLIFQNNDADIKVTDGYSVTVKNTITDKSFLWTGSINCQLGILNPETIDIKSRIDCDSPGEVAECTSHIIASKSLLFSLTIAFL